MASPADNLATPNRSRRTPFRHVVLRGLALIAPPLLTIAFFAWILSTIQTAVLDPIYGTLRNYVAWQIRDIREELPDATPISGEAGEPVFQSEGQEWFRLPRANEAAKDNYVPADVYRTVRDHTPASQMPTTGEEVYRRYVEIQYLKPYVVIPVFLLLFIALLYVLGRTLAAGAGRVVWNFFDGLIHRLPLVRNVYASVKQVTDFLFTEREIEYTRVVAVEYPRKGIWSIGLVTGESMLDIREAAGEPVLSVLIPSSPMPVTGYTITVLKREAVDLNISVDQAFQFCISCGVVVPPQELQKMISREESAGDETNRSDKAALSAPSGD